MASSQAVQDLSGGGVAPPLQLYMYTCRTEVEELTQGSLCIDQHAACHVIDVGRKSALGNPFALDWSRPETVIHAYNDLLSVVVWLGLRGIQARADVLVERIAEKHGVRLAQDAAAFDTSAAWQCLEQASASNRPLRLVGCAGSAARSTAEGRREADCIYGAITWLRDSRQATHCVPVGIGAKAGQWRLADIFTAWPREIASELAEFSWPLSSRGEVEALLMAPHARPRALIAFEFTAALREAYQSHWNYGRVALSVDMRDTLVAGPHARVDIRDVLDLCTWDDAYLHPPCTHQVLSDARAAEAKMLDGRAFWGVALFIYSWCIKAKRVLVEQPPTIIPNFYIQPTQSLRPCDVGDTDSKRFHLYERGGRRRLTLQPGAQGVSHHKRLRDFEDVEARDRWRSSWARYPKLCRAIVEAVDEQSPDAQELVYAEEIELFACAWHDAGLPVPAGYNSPQALPPSLAEQQYQSVRGRGDGRRPTGVVPISRLKGLTLDARFRGELLTHNPSGTHLCTVRLHTLR